MEFNRCAARGLVTNEMGSNKSGDEDEEEDKDEDEDDTREDEEEEEDAEKRSRRDSMDEVMIANTNCTRVNGGADASLV